MVFKNPFFFLFLSESSKFRVVWILRFCSNFTCRWCKHSLRNVWKDFRLSMLSLTTVAGKSSNGKFTAKIDFPVRYFMLPLLMLILEVYSLSIHYLINIWTTCWWNLNKIVWFELYQKKKKNQPVDKRMVNHFLQSFDAILEDVSVTETIV